MSPRIAILAVIIAVLPGLANAEPAKEPAKIVLFGARWCAPCTAELGMLPQLIAAGAGDDLELAWIDAPPPLDPAAPGVRMLPVREARALAEAIGGQGYGLPFAARFDSRDKPCAVWRAPLRPEDLATLRQQCERRQASAGP